MFARDAPPAAGRSYRSGPAKKWTVIGALILLLVGGGLIMLTVQLAMLLIVPLLAAGALYGAYRVLRNKLHRNKPRLEE